MCMPSPKAPPPAPPPPPPAPPAPVPELKLGKDNPDLDKSAAGLAKKGRKGLRIDMTSSAPSEGSGLNIPQ